MKLQNNPFFLFRLSCTAGRSEISEAFEEMSLILDDDQVVSAQSTLNNIQKRIGAELSWFIFSEEGKITELREKIQKGKTLPTDGLESVDKLNASLYNMEVLSEDLFTFGYEVLDIDRQYSQLNCEKIAEQLNSFHTKAHIGLVSVDDIKKEIEKKRGDIRSLISEKMDCYDQDDCIKLATIVAEKCISDNNYPDGVVLSDLIDHYEVKFQSILEEKAEAIKKQISHIKQLVDDGAIESRVGALIENIKRWDRLAQPIQLKNRMSGVEHQISCDIAKEVRGLAVFLHNEKEKSEVSLHLISEMKEVFAESESLRQIFENDASQLTELAKENEDANYLVLRLDGLEKEAKKLHGATDETIRSFIEKIQKVNTEIQESALNEESKSAARKNLYLIIRDASADLHNTYNETDKAFNLLRGIKGLFDDIATEKIRPANDYQIIKELFIKTKYFIPHSMMDSQPYVANGNIKAENKDDDKKAARIFIIVLVVFGLLAVYLVNRPKKVAQVEQKSVPTTVVAQAEQKPVPTTTAAPPSTKNTTLDSSTSVTLKYSPSTAIGTKVYYDIYSIEPVYGIYEENKNYYSEYVCECREKLPGMSAYLYISAYEYEKYFDSTINNNINSTPPVKRSFAVPKRVYGVVRDSKNVQDNLPANGILKVIEFDRF